ncbi:MULTISPECIES: nucleoside hydrolase [Vibrio harveyi group]|uniref:nucleoside hydrolase n=1 Tax=Vibrio harveyi group TaxID=717610 RepID=UPI0006825B95|nr:MULTISPECIES: nucleoside hydrolase [Vibrio harveyi group]ELC3206116.1 nucleoside hydrolase [Vibrio parahaemolyticus]MCR9815066.1 nucleoside hydrolase [Vibrio parahaemolyticus]MCR9818717.1 nucleoside hydrolase [Vibrio parahaemolyticus]PNM51900.1 nucleoside hydrolase [Vibrio harveyi]HBC3433021.1 nucleoside hydrolase [Vibrio parahaemolyticus]
MTFPNLSTSQRMALMEVPTNRRAPVVIDSDTFNEIDDQFAIAWTLLSDDRIDLQAIYAAPFTNNMFDSSHSAISDPMQGMALSFEEIHRVIERVTPSKAPKVCSGATRYLKDLPTLESTDATVDLIERSKKVEGVLQVVCIGAPTNIASAIKQDPSIIERIHVIWLGGNSYDWENTYEFNMLQDIEASRVLLDSGVALTQIPCFGVANCMASSVPEIQYYLKGTSNIGNYLAEEAPKCPWIGFGNRKVIWDITAVGYVMNPDWFTTEIVSSPILNDNFTYSFNKKRHPIRVVKFIERDELFIDMFKKLIEG